MGAETYPLTMEFVTTRNGVFDDVLQETVLTSFKKGNTSVTTKLRRLNPLGYGQLVVGEIGKFNIILDSGSPWLVPRSIEQMELVKENEDLPCKLKDYGYTV